jgi:RND superfamily putative drug exporter
MVPLPGTGVDERSEDALAVLREDVLPATAGAAALDYAVTGPTAASVDMRDQTTGRGPWIIALVLALSFIVLLFAFRSVVVPLKAVALNLLSVGAATGVLVLVFQHGWFDGLLGFEATGSVSTWVPVLNFLLLFGLSMDYHVFILSRIREGVDAGMTTDAAVREGIRSTASVVTSAALVMVGVFSIFATLSMIEVKQIGVGLAVAVLLDATIVRAVLLPATMTLLGERNWWMPAFLARLIGGAPVPEPASA